MDSADFTNIISRGNHMHLLAVDFNDYDGR